MDNSEAANGNDLVPNNPEPVEELSFDHYISLVWSHEERRLNYCEDLRNMLYLLRVNEQEQKQIRADYLRTGDKRVVLYHNRALKDYRDCVILSKRLADELDRLMQDVAERALYMKRLRKCKTAKLDWRLPRDYWGEVEQWESEISDRQLAQSKKEIKEALDEQFGPSDKDIEEHIMLGFIESVMWDGCTRFRPYNENLML